MASLADGLRGDCAGRVLVESFRWHDDRDMGRIHEYCTKAPTLS